MHKYDRTWAQINTGYKPVSLNPIGYINKQNLALRLIRAAGLWLSTNYSWKLSWHQAAK